MRSPTLLAACAAAACAVALTVPAGPSSAAPDAPRAAATAFTGPAGTYHPVGPTRIMDTRNGTGTGRIAKITGGHSTTLKVAGVAGLPKVGVGAVDLNVTVVNESAAHGFLTVYPSGAKLPTTSNINYIKGWTGANNVTVTVPSSGIIDFYTNTGTLDVVADLAGWYANSASTAAAGDNFVQTQQQRQLDTRNTDPSVGLNPMAPGREAFVPFDYSGFEPNSHVKAMVVTITAIDESTGGHLTAWSGVNPNSPPATSTLNFGKGVSTSNLAIVPVSPCPSGICPPASVGLPSIAIQNVSSGTVQVLVDVVGYFDDGTYVNGLRYRPRAAPLRIIDTRGGSNYLGTWTFGAGGTHAVQAQSNIATSDTVMLVGNATAIGPTASTNFTFFPDGGTRPNPYLSFSPPAARNLANAVDVAVSSTNVFDIYNSAGTANLAYDVSGTFEVPDAGNVAHTTKAQAAGRTDTLPVARLSAPGVRSN